MANEFHNEVVIVDINGAKFVSGLTWRSLKKGRTFMAEAKKIGRRDGMDMVAIRKTRTIHQAGFSPKTKGRVKGLYSLAAALASKLGDNWLGAFALADGRFALVAVMGGAVLPGRDIISDRNTIEDALREAYSLITEEGSDFLSGGKVFAPEDWEFAAESHQTLEELLVAKELDPADRLIHLHLTFGLTAKEVVLLGVLVLALVGFGYGGSIWWNDHQHKKALAAQAAAERARLAKKNDHGQMVKPWEARLPASALVQACTALWQGTPIYLGGWQFDKSTCDAAHGETTYLRHDATTLDQFLDGAKRLNLTPAIGDYGVSARIFATRPGPVNGVETLPLAEDQVKHFVSAMQVYSKDALTYTIATVPFVKPADQPDMAAPEWVVNSIVMNSKVPPHQLFENVSLAGIRITNITLTLDGKGTTPVWTWDITGDMYGR